jgi:hypothetical protein
VQGVDMCDAPEADVRHALGPDFPKHPLRKIVCVGALTPEGWVLRSGRKGEAGRCQQDTRRSPATASSAINHCASRPQDSLPDAADAGGRWRLAIEKMDKSGVYNRPQGMTPDRGGGRRHNQAI